VANVLLSWCEEDFSGISFTKIGHQHPGKALQISQRIDCQAVVLSGRQNIYQDFQMSGI
jgi:hypothetical protein